MDLVKYGRGCLGLSDTNLVDKVLDSEKLTEMFFGKVSENCGDFEFIRYYLGDKGALEFLDVMSNTVLKIPDSKKMSEWLFGSVIYDYYVSLGSDEGNIKFVAKKFGVTVSTARKYVSMFVEYDRSKEIVIVDTYSDDDDEDCMDYDDEDDCD